MGTTIHDAIVVTSWDEDQLIKAHDLADELGLYPTSISDRSNGYGSFLIPPDGSNHGWPTSQFCDNARENWKKQAHEYIDWIHIRYGEIEEGAVLVEHDLKPLSDERLEQLIEHDIEYLSRKLQKLRSR